MPGQHIRKFDLLAGQLGVWFGQQLDPGNPIYNAGEYLEIHGPIDIEIFSAALRRVVFEAESYRLRFIEEEGRPKQYIDISSNWHMHFSDVSQEENPQNAAESWMWANMHSPIDPKIGPLFTYALFKISSVKYIWYQRAHHIVIDGFSGYITASRLAEVYTALVNGEDCTNGAFPPFQVHVDAEIAYRRSEDYARDREYWSERLSDRPHVASLSGSRPVRTPRRFVRHVESISGADSADIRKLARSLKTSLTGIAIAATAAYVSSITGEKEVISGLPVTGRSGSLQRRTPGMMANIIPIRLDVHPGEQFSELTRRASQEVRQSLRYQRYRGEDIRRDLRMSGRDPLFGPMVNVMQFDYDLRFGEYECTPHSLANGPFDDLSISIYDRFSDGGFQIAFDANSDIYSAEDNSKHARRFVGLLEQVAGDASLTVGQLELLSEAERR
ncbi:condensation domain-containing protein, partial [Streptomyces sp. NPDC001279]|uniref:condensation domain-containing protein n=1 Tax=Streptomyces sp. NPDC001279 TaxID=3364556 RepID=UPI003693205C